MSTHKCIIYGLTGAGSRMVIEVPNYIAPCVPATPESSIRVETVLKTRKPKSASLNIKPTNGNRLVLGR